MNPTYNFQPLLQFSPRPEGSAHRPELLPVGRRGGVGPRQPEPHGAREGRRGGRREGARPLQLVAPEHGGEAAGLLRKPQRLRRFGERSHLLPERKR